MPPESLQIATWLLLLAKKICFGSFLLQSPGSERSLGQEITAIGFYPSHTRKFWEAFADQPERLGKFLPSVTSDIRVTWQPWELNTNCFLLVTVTATYITVTTAHSTCTSGAQDVLARKMSLNAGAHQKYPEVLLKHSGSNASSLSFSSLRWGMKIRLYHKLACVGGAIGSQTPF